MSWLYSSLTEEKLGEIVGCSTAFEIWQTLQNVYESSSTARIMGLRSQLQRIKKDRLYVSQYLVQIKDISDKFSAIGEPLSYRDHLAYILEGLGTEYNAFVTSIQNQTNRPSLANVQSLLMAYNARLEKQNTVEQLNLVQPDLANFSFNQANQRGQHSQSPGKSSPFPLSNPNPPPFPSTLPLFPSCVTSPGSTSKNSNRNPKWCSTPRPQCQICTKFGHTALTCYNRHNPAFQAPNNPRPPNPPQAFYSYFPNPNQPTPVHSNFQPNFSPNPSSLPIQSHPDDSWFMDSRATHHMTPDLSNLQQSQPYGGNEQVIVGNDHSFL